MNRSTVPYNLGMARWIYFRRVEAGMPLSFGFAVGAEQRPIAAKKSW